MAFIKNLGFRPLHFNHMGCVAFLFAPCAISLFRSVATVHKFIHFGVKISPRYTGYPLPPVPVTKFHQPEQPQ